MNLGENIKLARKAAGLTQTELGEKIGVSQREISRWEINKIVPNVLIFAEICKALNASSDEILELKR
ncbi:MAG: helix-turn-helix transcriptional regulator [Eubacteriales bacterium]|nr:helix-turn-helix transcriptional regulator [Eubacteriales bacterium]